MKRFIAAIKASLLPVIIGIVAIIVGIVLLIVGSSSEKMVLLVVGFFVTVGGGAVSFMFARANYKQRIDAICPECEKFMGDTNNTIHYSYQFNDIQVKNSNTHYYYTCTIQCPHCGSTHTFEHDTIAKNQAEANVYVTKYLKIILKLKK